jgi:hypothetical protein
VPEGTMKQVIVLNRSLFPSGNAQHFCAPLAEHGIGVS